VFSIRRPVVLASVVAAGTFAGAAFAYVCHPGVQGTRMLAVRGSVVSVHPRGAAFDLLLKTGSGRCTQLAWSAATGITSSVKLSCSVAPIRLPASSEPPKLIAGPAAHRVAVVHGMLDVYGPNGKLLRALPLPATPTTLASSGGIAVFSARSQGVFAMRLSDGLYGFLGPDGGSFAPRLDAKGVIFHDGESKAALRKGVTVLEFASRAAIMKMIARTAEPLVTGGPIRSISMDGPRVAVAVGDTKGLCDRVLYWNVAWWPAQRVSSPAGVTCMVRPHGIEIPAVAIGGFRAEWLTTGPGGMRLVAGSPLCQEWVLGRFASPGEVSALGGDGSTLVFAATVRGRTTVFRVNGRYRPVRIASGRGVPRVAVDGARVALLWPNGNVTIRSVEGSLLGTVRAGTARAVALEGNELVALSGGRLVVFDVTSGRRVHSFAVATNARSLDLAGRIAAFASGSRAVVLDTATGRSAVVGRGSTALRGVQIEGPGLAYAWSSGTKGTARFVTTYDLDRALGLAGS
jgi:hypothetical protein